MDNAETGFSDKELDYLQDTDFLLTQAEINHKMKNLLRSTEKKIAGQIPNFKVKFPPGTLDIAGKISKGLAYRKLPYFVLDYPRNFSTEGVFAYRTMFWWGNFFSVTLHLQGKCFAPFRKSLKAAFSYLHQSNFYLCVNESPWEYHYEESNYRKFNQIDEIFFTKQLEEKEFIKISRQLPMQNWRTLPDFSADTFRILMQLL